jgi:hypothetical protein
VPEEQESVGGPSEDPAVEQARHEAAEIIAQARRNAEAIVAESRAIQADSPSPLAALGDNAEEIIGQVRKLIKKQRKLEAERQTHSEERDEMVKQIQDLEAERDELVQRLTDAVVRMEELVVLADAATMAEPQPATSPNTDRVDRVERQDPTSFSEPVSPAEPLSYAAVAEMEEDPPGANSFEPAAKEDTSLAARLQRAEKEEDTSLAARLQQAEKEEDTSLAARLQRADSDEPAAAEVDPDSIDFDDDPVGSSHVVDADGRSFYSRHSAKLPRLEGDGGRSVLSAVGGMRLDNEPKGRKSRRRKKEK